MHPILRALIPAISGIIVAACSSGPTIAPGPGPVINTSVPGLPAATTTPAVPSPTIAPTPTVEPPVRRDLPAPSIQGLTAERDAAGGTIYRAAAGNPYGLSTGDVAGAFYVEVFDFQPGAATGDQVGGVVLRPQVMATLLTQAGAGNGAPASAARLPIPADPTSATASRTVIVQEADQPDKLHLVFLRLPTSAKLVFPFDLAPGAVRPAPYAARTEKALAVLKPFTTNGGSITVPFPLLQDRFPLDIVCYCTVPQQEVGGSAGDPILQISQRPFGDDRAAASFANLLPPPALSSNLYLIDPQEPPPAPEPRARMGLTKRSLLRAGSAFVFVMSNDNPLLRR